MIVSYTHDISSRDKIVGTRGTTQRPWIRSIARIILHAKYQRTSTKNDTIDQRYHRFSDGMPRKLLHSESARIGRSRTFIERTLDVRSRFRYEHQKSILILLELGTECILSIEEQQQHRDNARTRDARDENAIGTRRHSWLHRPFRENNVRGTYSSRRKILYSQFKIIMKFIYNDNRINKLRSNIST